MTQQTFAVDDSDDFPPQRLLVVDELEMVQEGLWSILTDQPWVSACLVASNAETAWQIARRQHPQIVLISSSLADGAAIVLCRSFRERMPHVRVILTAGDERMSAARGRALGIAGSVSKEMSATAIADSVRRIVAGERYFPRSQPCEVGIRLKARELEVLRRVAAGSSNGEVAIALSLSKHTIKQCVSDVYRKLGVRNRAEAAGRARELGLLR